jgi:hypothetical protein
MERKEVLNTVYRSVLLAVTYSYPIRRFLRITIGDPSLPNVKISWYNWH